MSLELDTNLVNPDLIVQYNGPPHALFSAWREADPVHWNPPPAPGAYVMQDPGVSLHKGFWVLTRYRDVYEVSRNQELFSSHVNGPIIWDYNQERLTMQQAGLMGMPTDRHAKVKRLVLPPFANQSLSAFEPAIARSAVEIVDSIASRGECEFVFEVASRLPVSTFCTLMGIPAEDHDLIFKLGNALADIEDKDASVPRKRLLTYATELAEKKRKNPDGSIMSMLIQGDVDGERLPDDQIGMFFLTMSIAGHETTRSTAAHFIRLMNENPDQYALLLSDPAKYLPNAIDEVLRCSPPVIQFRRTVTRNTTIGDVPVSEGDKIYLSYAAANRDPSVFADPDRFDITRDNAAKHLSFGNGPHVCLGARLARIQLRLLLEQVVRRIPDIQLASPPTFLRSIWFNAIIKMPVTFTPEPRL